MKAEEIRPITFSDGAILKIAEVKAGFPSPAADFTGETIDLNHRFGTNKVRPAAQGFSKVMSMRQKNLSPCYSTRLADVITVKIDH